MSFFNKKEEVMEIQLTAYGKYLLSKGKFKPAFYAFSDDEVLYDNSYGENKVEIKKESSERIQEDTIRIRPIYDNESAETRVARLNEQIAETTAENTRSGILSKMPPDALYGSDNVDDILMVPDDRKLVRNLLGNSELGNKEAPSWSVVSLNAQRFETPIEVSSSGPNIGMRRPQINMIVDYDLESEYLPEDQDFNMEQYVEQDGTEGQITFVDRVKLHVARNQIVLEIAEDNVSYDNENFEIEFFTVDDEEEIVRNGVTVKDEKLTSLYLSRPGVDRARSLKTYFEVLYDNQVSMARDYDFETFIIEEPDDEEFCD
jgi:hypothetical protein|tara:strand:+ start:2913 stop:3863 length:951 start_codon:yes stop_codon:yes gene_type:complete